MCVFNCVKVVVSKKGERCVGLRGGVFNYDIQRYFRYKCRAVLRSDRRNTLCDVRTSAIYRDVGLLALNWGDSTVCGWFSVAVARYVCAHGAPIFSLVVFLYARFRHILGVSYILLIFGRCVILMRSFPIYDWGGRPTLSSIRAPCSSRWHKGGFGDSDCYQV